MLAGQPRRNKKLVGPHLAYIFSYVTAIAISKNVFFFLIISNLSEFSLLSVTKF